MRNISVSEEIMNAASGLKIGAIKAKIIYKSHDDDLWQKILIQSEKIVKLGVDEVKLIPQIESTRNVYKNLGKEPSRYRPSAEALMRRLILGKEMYKISNVVDCINLTSITTGYSIGGYDDDSIFGEVEFKRGDSNTLYEAIGRGVMNIEGLPVFFDEIGAFGSPTSDSVRTMITPKTKNILLLVMNFANHKNFENDLKFIEQLLIDYCEAENIEVNII